MGEVCLPCRSLCRERLIFVPRFNSLGSLEVGQGKSLMNAPCTLAWRKMLTSGWSAEGPLSKTLKANSLSSIKPNVNFCSSSGGFSVTFHCNKYQCSLDKQLPYMIDYLRNKTSFYPCLMLI